MVGMSHLDEDVGAGAMEAVGPGIERGDKGAAFQGTAPWAGTLLTFPVSHGALAVCGEGEPERWAGLLGPDGTPGCSGLASWLPPGLRPLCLQVPRVPRVPILSVPSQAAPHSPGAAGICCDLPGGIGQPAKRAGTLGDRHTGEVFGDVVKNRTCRRGLPGAAARRDLPPSCWAATPGPVPRRSSRLALGLCPTGGLGCDRPPPAPHCSASSPGDSPSRPRPRPGAAPGERRALPRSSSNPTLPQQPLRPPTTLWICRHDHGTLWGRRGVLAPTRPVGQCAGWGEG